MSDHSLQNAADDIPRSAIVVLLSLLLVLAAVLAVYALTDRPRRDSPLPVSRADPVLLDIAAEGPAVALPAELPAMPLPAVETALTQRMRAVLEYTARRYRVSAAALQPVFAAAQVTAGELGLDPLLIIAVIGIESSFNPLSESTQGAQGLMQVIPRFHRDKFPVGADGMHLFDPVANVRVGARALKEYIRDIGDVAEGLQQFAGSRDDVTQSYAEKVLAERDRLESAARRQSATASAMPVGTVAGPAPARTTLSLL